MFNQDRLKNIPKYSLGKSKKILLTSYAWYKKRGKSLSPQDLKTFESTLEACDQAILQGDTLKSSQLAEELEIFTRNNFKKTIFDYTLELIVSLSCALFIACIVRMMWFEPYEIPTGSMRPTFKEQDHLTVTKTAFGINIPFETKHFYFDPSLIQRTSVVIFSADEIPVPDPDTTYFGLFPYKKRLIKRLIGKPGDSLYFYGGQIYGVDAHGKPIKELLESPWLEKIEHIPFLSFEGDLSMPNRHVIQFEQMHQPIGRLIQTSDGKLAGEVYNGSAWIKDDPLSARSPHRQIKTYGDYLGMHNYAVARLLTKKELSNFPDIDTKTLEEAPLYLQLMHDPNLAYPTPLIHQKKNFFGISLIPYVSIIPLTKDHLKTLMDNMYTARFLVKEGVAYRYNVPQQPPTHLNPPLPGIPDGKYEFYYGKAYQIGWGGIPWELPADHPLYRLDPPHVQSLFNFGIDMNLLVGPSQNNLVQLPHRYAYFRNGDLYLLGAPVLTKEDPSLQEFLEKEEKKEKNATTVKPYIAFKDHGAPFKDGELDVSLIRSLGITVPPKSYLVLGDNHAMSGDSRVFGFVPEQNLQGAPSLILWPPGPRWGSPAQKPYPIFATPRLIIWGLALVIALGSYMVYRIRFRRPVYKKIL